MNSQLTAADICTRQVAVAHKGMALNEAARLMRERFGAEKPASWAFRTGAGSGASQLTAQQPENNIVRVTLNSLAAILGGAQSLHTAAYDEALALLPDVDRESQRPGLMMANIYRTLLQEIEDDGFQVLHQRTSLTPLRKLWIAARTQWQGH